MKAESIGLSANKVKVSDKIAIESVRTKITVLFWGHKTSPHLPYTKSHLENIDPWSWGDWVMEYPTPLQSHVKLICS